MGNTLKQCPSYEYNGHTVIIDKQRKDFFHIYYSKKFTQKH